MSITALGAGAEKAQKILFISEAHEKFYYEKLKEIRKTEERFALPHHKRLRNMKYLQSYLEYICRHKKNDAA